MEGAKVGSIYYDLDLEDKKFKEKSKETTQELKKIKTSFLDAEKGSMVFMGGLTAVGASLSAVVTKSTLTAARTETLGIAMEAVAKATGTSIDMLKEQEATLKKQGITTQEARSTLTKFMQSQLDVAQASEIARVAQDLAVIAGENSSQTTARLTDAIATMNPMLLRSVGIVKNQSEVFDVYAETLGKSADDLTEVEKKQALVNLILEEGKKVAGTYESAMDTAGKKMGSLARYFEEAQNAIGNIFLPVFEVLIDELTKFLKLITQENIEEFIVLLRDNFPIIAGAILGGLVPALVALGVALWTSVIIPFIALLPYIAVGAAIGLGIKYLIDKFGGLEGVMEEIQPVIDEVKEKVGELTEFYKDHKTWIDNIVVGITIFFIPALLNLGLQAVIAGAMIAVNLTLNIIKFWGEIIFATTKIWLFIASIIVKTIQIGIATAAFILHTAITVGATVATTALTVATWLLNTALAVLTSPIFLVIAAIIALIATGVLLYKNWDTVKQKGEEALDFLRRKWEDFWNFIENLVKKIVKELDKINPFHRESPSLVENVQSGVEEIINQFDRFKNIDMPNINALVSGNIAGVGNTQQDVQIYIDKVGNQQDVDAIGRELGFRIGLEPR